MLMFLFVSSIITSFIGGMIFYSICLDIINRSFDNEPVYPKVKKALGKKNDK